MEEYMNVAFQLAEAALEDGEVPIGCVFVYAGSIIGRGRNTVNATHNATRHAEMNAIDQLISWATARNLPLGAVMKDTCLYVNVEPCAMCADALHQLALGQLVYGCSNDKFGGFGSVVDVGSIRGQNSAPMRLRKGVRASEAVLLLKKFYEGVNPHAPSHKVKTRNKLKPETSKGSTSVANEQT